MMGYSTLKYSVTLFLISEHKSEQRKVNTMQSSSEFSHTTIHKKN